MYDQLSSLEGISQYHKLLEQMLICMDAVHLRLKMYTLHCVVSACRYKVYYDNAITSCVGQDGSVTL